MKTFESLGIEITLTSFPYGAMLIKSMVSVLLPLKGSFAFVATSTPIKRIFCLLGEKLKLKSSCERFLLSSDESRLKAGR